MPREQDDYRDIGGRESQEHFLEQLPRTRQIRRERIWSRFSVPAGQKPGMVSDSPDLHQTITVVRDLNRDILYR